MSDTLKLDWNNEEELCARAEKVVHDNVFGAGRTYTDNDQIRAAMEREAINNARNWLVNKRGLVQAEAENAALREREAQRNTQIVRLIAEAAAKRETWERVLLMVEQAPGYPHEPRAVDKDRLAAAIRAAMEE